VTNRSSEEQVTQSRKRRWGGLREKHSLREGMTLSLDTGPDTAGSGQSRWRTGSPIARRIMTVNAVAMSVLFVGVLFLNQSEDSLIEQRARTLVIEAEVAARALGAFAGERQDMDLEAESVFDVMRVIARPDGATIRVYDRETMEIASSESIVGREVQLLQAAMSSGEVAPQATSDDETVWDRLANRLTQSTEETANPSKSIGPHNAGSMILTALDGRTVSQAIRDEDGNLILSIAMPIYAGTIVKGAVTLSTPAGDIDAIVARERLEVLILFALALFVSVVLTAILSGNIARPLRQLAAAAEAGGDDGAGGKFAAERIRIPDMSHRPDEIGYLSQAMRGMTNALFDRIEANESFAADVAHEIKNPLTSLRSAVETMRYAKTDDQRERLIGVIENDVGRLDRLVTDISNASRLDSELVREEMEEFDLARLTENLVEYNQGVAEDAGAALVLDRPEEPLTMRGLEGRIAQIIINLITNALSFSEEGQTVRTIVRRKDARHLRVEVKDQGPGIPDDNLEDVFERFYSERPGQEFGNHSGLGLAISRQIAEAHDGKLWVENIRAEGHGRDDPRLGARFILEIPV
jgi:two-component system sensor histidine kinase ChvG